MLRRLARRARACSLHETSESATTVPPKIRELIAELVQAGFMDRGGKGSHRNCVHPKVARPVTISGNPGDDAKLYQIRAVHLAIEESRK